MNKTKQNKNKTKTKTKKQQQQQCCNKSPLVPVPSQVNSGRVSSQINCKFTQVRSSQTHLQVKSKSKPSQLSQVNIITSNLSLMFRCSFKQVISTYRLLSVYGIILCRVHVAACQIHEIVKVSESSDSKLVSDTSPCYWLKSLDMIQVKMTWVKSHCTSQSQTKSTVVESQIKSRQVSLGSNSSRVS